MVEEKDEQLEEFNMNNMTLPIGKTTLEIRLSDDQLEHIANGGMITLDTSQPLTCEKITISPSLVNDVASPIVRRDKTLISRRDLAIKDIVRDSFQMGMRQQNEKFN